MNVRVDGEIEVMPQSKQEEDLIWLEEEKLTDENKKLMLQWSYLELAAKGIHTFPPNLPFLSSLHRFHAISNNISVIPSNINFLKHLKVLYLSHNNIHFIPPKTLSPLLSLEELYLAENNLSEFPVGLPSLSLRVLDLGYNLIQSIPEEIEEFTSLEHFIIWHNNLTSLPPSMRYLLSLTRFWADDNQMTSIPLCLRFLTNLKDLHLGNNPIQDKHVLGLIEKIPRLPPKDFISLLNTKYVNQCQPNFRCKLFIVGNTNSGKTHLLNILNPGARKMIKKTRESNKRFVSNVQEHLNRSLAMQGPSSKNPDLLNASASRVKPEKDLDSTEGVDLRRITLYVDKKRVTINAWEFAGNDLYKPAANIFFHNERAMYLVVYNMLDTRDTGLSYWLPLIRSRAYSAPIIVLGTHGDNPRINDQYKESIHSKMIKKVAPYSVSEVLEYDPSRAESVSQLKHSLGNAALSLPHMGELVPPNYVIMRDIIAKLDTRSLARFSYEAFSLSWSEYVDFIKYNQKVALTTQELKEITRTLHRDGSLLFLEKGEEGSLRPGAFDTDGNITTLLEGRVVFHMKFFLTAICLLVKQVNEYEAQRLKKGFVISDTSTFYPYISKWLKN